MKEQKKNPAYWLEEHGHEYVCEDIATGIVIVSNKLPPILKDLRIATDYTFKIPHGNKVRTLILEEGMCIIKDNEDTELYKITIKRW